MQGQPTRPIPNSYWVQPGKLLAGEYPRTPYDQESRVKLRHLLEAGVTFFLNLTETKEYGVIPYVSLLREEAAAMGQSVEHFREPIPDWSIPSPEVMKLILDTIDIALAEGKMVYVHCFAGIGRTGTVIGCYLVRHGLSGEAALAEIARLRQGVPTDWMDSPEVEVQRQMVRAWQGGE